MSAIDTIETEYPAKAAVSVRIQSMPKGTIAALVCWLGDALTKRRTRMHLSELSDELLDDIGLSPSQARRETKRFFWE